MKFNQKLFEQLKIPKDHKYGKYFIQNLNYEKLVSSIPDKNKPIFNWYYYKPSFSSVLVESMINHLKITKDNTILDPFCGIGTTALVCKQKDVNSLNCDISPLAIFVSKVKTNSYNIPQLKQIIKETLNKPYVKPTKVPTTYYIRKSYDPDDLFQFQYYLNLFNEIKDKKYSDFMKLALISIMDKFTIARKDGAFLRFNPPGNKLPISELKPELIKKLKSMLDGHINKIDYFINKNDRDSGNDIKLEIKIGDSRNLPFKDGCCDYIITSPPYLNRYDYTRLYALELEFLFLDDDGLKKLRKNTLRSHTEAAGYEYKDVKSTIFKTTIDEIKKRKLSNIQIPSMIKSYFSDMQYCLEEYSRVLKENGKVVLIVGNSRFSGIHVEVDSILCEISESLNFTVDEIIVAKLRGSSVQQIGYYGEIPLRESIIICSKNN